MHLLALSVYQDSDASMKIKDFYFEEPSTDKKLPNIALMEEIKALEEERVRISKFNHFNNTFCQEH